MKFYKKLEEMNACSKAVEWSMQFSSLQKAWDKCDRGDWMFWLLGMKCDTINQRKLLTLTACQCARISLKYVKKGEKRPLKAIQTAERWAKDDPKVSLEDVQKAAAYVAAAAPAIAYAAPAIAYAAAATAAAAATTAAYVAAAATAAVDAAAYAAAATATAYAAYVAAYDAYVAADADAAYDAYDAAYDAAAARIKTFKKCADIVRKHYPKAPII